MLVLLVSCTKANTNQQIFWFISCSFPLTASKPDINSNKRKTKWTSKQVDNCQRNIHYSYCSDLRFMPSLRMLSRPTLCTFLSYQLYIKLTKDLIICEWHLLTLRSKNRISFFNQSGRPIRRGRDSSCSNVHRRTVKRYWAEPYA